MYLYQQYIYRENATISRVGLMDKAEKPIPNTFLQTARKSLGLTQAQVAENIGVDTDTIGCWERGTKFPALYARQKLCTFFKKKPAELGFFLDEAKESNPETNRPLHHQELPYPLIWNVPYERNPFFTGREQILQQLHSLLVKNETTVLTQALSGLGGVGKTQIAVEYCYLYRSEYKAVLWVNADSPEDLTRNLITIAKLLKLPESTSKNQQTILNALREWMRRLPRWLLVIDNIEDLEIVKSVIPPARRGHVILTTRTQITGNYPKIDIQDMQKDEGALLALRRANFVAQNAPLDSAEPSDREAARQLSYTLGGLPLALEQAGAYIQETSCGLSGYLEQYQLKRTELLKYRGEFSSNYPESVATTWSLSFERIEKTNAAAADLLRASAFLHPDAIPEELFMKGARELGPTFLALAQKTVTLDQIIRVILRYSLLRRNPREKTLSIHRLVQAVLIDGMDQETQRAWAERVIKAVNSQANLDSLIDQPKHKYSLQTQACIQLINQWNFRFLEAAQIVCAAGHYLYDDGYYKQAEKLCLEAYDMFQKISETSVSDICRCFIILVSLKIDSGDYGEAEMFGKHLLATSEKAFGSEDLMTALSNNFLATIYLKQDAFDQAEPLLKKAYAIVNYAASAQKNVLIEIEINLAILLDHQGKTTESQKLYQRALMSAENMYGSNHPLVANILSELATHHSSRGNHQKSEELLKQGTEIYTQFFDTDHPDVARAYARLSTEYFSQGRYSEAEEYYERALKIFKSKYYTSNPGDETSESIFHNPGGTTKKEKNFHHFLQSFDSDVETGENIATVSNKLANSYIEHDQYNEAQKILWHALEVSEAKRGKKDLVTVFCLNNLARFYQSRKTPEMAEFLYERAIQLAGIEFNFQAGTLQIARNYIQFLQETGKNKHATDIKRSFSL